MSTVRIELPPKLVPVFTGPAIFRAAYGGRGSGKSRSFALMAAIRGMMFAQANKPGLIVCGREYMNSLLDSSFAEVREAIKSVPWLDDFYEIGDKYIRTKCRRVSFAFVGLHHNLDSIKSKSRIRILWVDEAEPVTESAWSKSIPTVREDESEVWVTWNPERKNSATHKRFRLIEDADTKIVELNWRDNPWFPKLLDKLRLKDQRERPEQYEHIWEGGFATVLEGAYFAQLLTKAKQEGRIGFVAADDVLKKRVFIDIGGAGAKADNMSFWVAQWPGSEIRVLDHWTTQGQVIAYHIAELRKRGLQDALLYFPHDGLTTNSYTGKRYADHFKDADFECVTVPNQGTGAAMARVEAARRLFSRIRFNEATTEAGRDALGWYHEKRDEERNIGLGPEHDWSSHDADAFGMMCVAYEEPEKAFEPFYGTSHGRVGWLGG